MITIGDRAAANRSPAPWPETPELSAVADRIAAMIPAEGSLREILAWHFSAGGGMTRARLAVRAGLAMGLRADAAADVAAIVQAVHEASLLVDDINDCSWTRRGQRAAWVRFGRDQSMLAAIRLLTTAQRLSVAAFPEQPGVVAIIADVVAAALDGQATELIAVPRDWNEYDWIVRRKTGGLMALPVLVAAQAAGTSEEMARTAGSIAERIGIAYQIADDIADGAFDAMPWAGVRPPPPQRLSALKIDIAAETKSLGAIGAVLSRAVSELLP